MGKQILASILLVMVGVVAEVNAQTTRGTDSVPMPPVIETLVSQLAELRDGAVTPAVLTAIVTSLSTDFAIPAGYEHPRIEFAAPAKMAAVRYSAFGAERLARALGDASDESFLRQMRDIMALYEDASRTIYLRQDWNAAKPADFSLLVHEIVHHLQNVGGLKYGCAEEREKPAYAAQRKWLEAAGRNFFEEFETDPMSLALRTMCGF
jgi:hypothetical protein